MKKSPIIRNEKLLLHIGFLRRLEITPIKTYLELRIVVQFLQKLLLAHQIDINKNFVSWVGLRCTGINDIDLQGYKCKTNHYLQEALGVKALPSFGSLNKEMLPSDSFRRLCDVIENTLPYEKSSNMNFKEAVNYMAMSLLDLLRKRGDIKGEDKYFTTEQKSKLSEEGYLIIPSVLNNKQVQKLGKLTLFIAQKEDEAGVSYRYGEEANRLQRVYNLISKHPAYIELLELPLINEILEYYFARDNLHHKYVLSSFQSNIIHPGGGGQQLHVDGWSFSGVPLPQWTTRLNVNFLLTDWTQNNGSTMISPGSHKLFRSPAPEEIPDSALFKIIAPKGSLVLWSGHVWHKSGTNNSKDPRFGLFACFAASQLKEVSTEEEHLSVVDSEVKNRLSPELRFMIGLDRGIKKGALHRVDFTGTDFEI